MAMNQKQKQALAKAKKRRLKRPESTFVESKSLAMKTRERDRFTSKHPIALLKLETAIVEFADGNDDVNDSIVANALTCCITDSESQDEIVTVMVAFLNQVRSDTLGDDQQSRETWIDAMRAVYQSVKTRGQMHGGDNSGDRGYLNFAKQFIRNSQRKMGRI